MTTKPQVKNYYQILEIPQTASIFEIQNAYQKLATQWHPDKHKENRKIAQQRFHDISQSYEVLSDRNSRSHFDEILNQQFNIDSAMKTFVSFFNENGITDKQQQEFLKKHHPQRQQNYYQVLGVTKHASPGQIKDSYRKLALQFHPKSNPGNKSVQKRFMKINQAYSTLSDLNKRETYDTCVFGKINVHQALNIFEDFWSKRTYDIPNQEDVFKPILRNKWSRDLNKMTKYDDFGYQRTMEDRNWDNKWNTFGKPECEDQAQTVKTSTVYNRDSRGQSKKTVSRKQKVINGIVTQVTNEQYLYPNGHKEITQTTNDQGIIRVKRFDIAPGQPMPKELTL